MDEVNVRVSVNKHLMCSVKDHAGIIDNRNKLISHTLLPHLC